MGGIFVGLDPGGANKFGWAVIEDSKELPRNVLNSAVADHDAAAVCAAIANARPDQPGGRNRRPHVLGGRR